MKPKEELEINKKLDEEREISDDAYAPMIVKTIVFAFIALICVAFISWLTHLVWNM